MTPSDFIGYLEHATPDKLWHFTANHGKGGCTVFSEMVDREQRVNLQGLPWCATFVHAMVARPDLLGRAHPGTRVLARRMKRKGLWRDPSYKPKQGDLIFLANFKRIDHCAIVESADDKTVTSIDGNTHDLTGKFKWDEGGAVTRITRERTDIRIMGYAEIGDKYAH